MKHFAYPDKMTTANNYDTKFTDKLSEITPVSLCFKEKNKKDKKYPRHSKLSNQKHIFICKFLMKSRISYCI